MNCVCTARADNAVNACVATRRVVAGASRKRNYFWNFSSPAQNTWEDNQPDLQNRGSPLAQSPDRVTLSPRLICAEGFVSSAELHAKLVSAVDTNWSAQLGWLQTLVGFPSLRGQEGPCQDWIARELASRGWAVDRYTLAEVAMDHLPGFSPVMDTDYSKAVQVVASLRAPAGTGSAKGRSLILQGHVDVVPTGPADMWSSPPFAATIENGRMRGRGANDMKSGVCAMAFALDALRSAGCLPATNAILSTFGLIEALRGHTRDLNERVKSHPWFSRIPNPIKFNPGKIAGGDWASSTPAWCEVDCRIAVLPGMTLADFREELTGVVMAAARQDPFLADNPPQVIWNGFQADDYVLEPGSDFENAVRAAHRRVHGNEPGEVISPAVTDCRFYGRYYGIPSLSYGATGSGNHGFDEAVEIESIKTLTLTLASFIADWCGSRAA
jgi:acetylornithine deacetylase/succinyl-diaminopimelate desuccinylase-like protein